jgi:hypothetical protein
MARIPTREPQDGHISQGAVSRPIPPSDRLAHDHRKLTTAEREGLLEVVGTLATTVAKELGLPMGDACRSIRWATHVIGSRQQQTE